MNRNAMLLHIPDRSDQYDHVIDDIEAQMEAIGAEYDGTERSDRELTVFSYGPDANKMFAAIEDQIDNWQLPSGSTVQLEFGDLDDPSTPVFTIPVGAGEARTPKPVRRCVPKKLYKVGDWYVVDMFGFGYMVGRVVAASGPMTISYFFMPLHVVIPELIEVEHLRVKDAFTHDIGNDVHLRDGGGAIILGGHQTFDKRKWPNPEFVFTDHRGQRWGVRHDDDLEDIAPFRRLPLRPAPDDQEYTISLGDPFLKLAVTLPHEDSPRPGWSRPWMNPPTREPSGWIWMTVRPLDEPRDSHDQCGHNEVCPMTVDPWARESRLRLSERVKCGPLAFDPKRLARSCAFVDTITGRERASRSRSSVIQRAHKDEERGGVNHLASPA
jgi:hypothetical protein